MACRADGVVIERGIIEMLIKLLVMHHLYDDNDLPGMERFFWRYHAPEVMQFAPKMTRYVNFRAVPPPPGAEEYGHYN